MADVDRGGGKHKQPATADAGPKVILPSGTVVMVTASAPEELPWREMLWHGLPMLRCRLCPYDTLEGVEAMIEHIEARHAPEPPPAPLVQAYDASGNPKS